LTQSRRAPAAYERSALDDNVLGKTRTRGDAVLFATSGSCTSSDPTLSCFGHFATYGPTIQTLVRFLPAYVPWRVTPSFARAALRFCGPDRVNR